MVRERKPLYDAGFYDHIRPGCRASARATVPVILEYYRPSTVIDIGCGEGHWARAFADYASAEVIGIDGNRPPNPVIDRFIVADLTEPIPLAGICRFDLAVCLEVAEHLPEERGDALVEELCDLSDVVLFSAAQPGQGGTGHINCQPAEYWAQRFELAGYTVTGKLRDHLWDDDRIDPWYRSNLLLAAYDPSSILPGIRSLGPVTTLTHPDLYLVPPPPVTPPSRRQQQRQVDRRAR